MHVFSIIFDAESAAKEIRQQGNELWSKRDGHCSNIHLCVFVSPVFMSSFAKSYVNSLCSFRGHFSTVSFVCVVWIYNVEARFNHNANVVWIKRAKWNASLEIAPTKNRQTNTHTNTIIYDCKFKHVVCKRNKFNKKCHSQIDSWHL